ncbi:TetR/AcrR family transcriptional regulator [Sneathiella sp.]|jgi:AcrR family transcriptional regulator|uniref:TetR/AcrR family transcriptional regulator n=1 Tax=Sneathiella sp. TaxID=1964365 RepID=UPI0039E3BFFD
MKRKPFDIQGQIIQAAQARFLTYGYGKTTMVELGEDVGLSPAHLYNFFPAKLDIAVAIVVEESRRQARELSLFLDPSKRAAQILPLYFMEELSLNYQAREEHPGMSDLRALVKKRKPLIARECTQIFAENMGQYLRSRMQKGEIAGRDPDRTAEILHNATFLFRNLDSAGEASLDSLKRQLDDIMTALLRGIIIGRE